MKKNNEIAILSDHCVGKNYKSRDNVFLISLYVLSGDKSFKETDLTEKLFSEIYYSKEALSTTKPNESEFQKVYEDIFKQGYKKIIVLTISSEISGTYQSAVNAANDYNEKEKRISVIDSRTASIVQVPLIDSILKLIDLGLDFDKILQKMDGYIDNIFGGFFTGDLKHLVKSGRIGYGKALIGTVLNLKPMLRGTGSRGVLEVWAKPRSYKGVYKEMYNTYKPYENISKDIYIGTGLLNTHIKDECKDYFLKMDPDINFKDFDLSYVIMSNFGMESLTISFYKKTV